LGLEGTWSCQVCKFSFACYAGQFYDQDNQYHKDYPGAIQDFQVCLRVVPEDQSLWVRLGEAYAKAGKQIAAIKSLNRASELHPDDWICQYIRAEVKYQMGLFEDTILILSNIIQSRLDEAGPLVLISRAHLDLGLAQLAGGFRIRAEESFLSAIRFALDIIARVTGFRSTAWKLIGDAATYLSSLSTIMAEDAVRSTLGSIPYLPPPDWADKVVKIVGLPSLTDGMPIEPLTIVTTAIHAYLSQLSLASLNQSHPVGWYDFSVAIRSWTLLAQKSVSAEDMSLIKEKVFEALKKAVQADPANDLYWVGLGNAYFATHAKIAQHAYIQALNIDSGNAATWVILGLLYFHYGDVELANEAFYRAQVLDPDNTASWIGQFLVARANNDHEDATRLLEHAVGLVDPMVNILFSFYLLYHSIVSGSSRL
jgi:superkiller protein 3